MHFGVAGVEEETGRTVASAPREMSLDGGCYFTASGMGFRFESGPLNGSSPFFFFT